MVTTALSDPLQTVQGSPELPQPDGMAAEHRKAGICREGPEARSLHCQLAPSRHCWQKPRGHVPSAQGALGEALNLSWSLVLPQMPWQKGWQAQCLGGHTQPGLSDTPGSHFGEGRGCSAPVWVRPSLTTVLRCWSLEF